MARGVKLDLNIGAKIDAGWNQIEETHKVTSDVIAAPEKHLLVFKREKRRGKVVTLVGPFSLSQEDVLNVLKKAKKKLGCGGSYKESWMEFQGELQEKLAVILQEEHFRFRKKN
jgi:translation initiation factor 1